jgi:ATP-binding cassette subfamily F protein 3
MATLLQVNNLCKSYDVEPLFDELTLSVSTNQHIGVIGRNGAGKSTLFRIIVGEEESESGDVIVYNDTRIGYLRQQETLFGPTETVIDFLMRSSGKEEWECAKMAGIFDIKKEALVQPITSFAGGYQMRVSIIAMLLDEPNLLLLDEPTNYLDLSTLLLLENFLRNFSGSFLLISHDREFLKRTCTETLEIAHGKARYYAGPLEAFLTYKAEQDEFARRYNKKIAKQQRHMQDFVDRFRYKASKASQAQSLLKKIQKLETITILNPLKTASITIPRIPDKKGIALTLDDVSIGYTDKLVADHVSFQIERGEHVAIVGNNGQGKSTLLKTIAGTLPLLSGTMKFGVHLRIGYYAQHVPEMLNPKDQVLSHLQHCAGPSVPDQEILRMAGNFLFHGDDVKKPISVLSGGEKARLCLAGLLLQKFDMLLLDEPTNHLDFETVEALAGGLSESNITILFVSHNRTFVQQIATSVIEVGGGRVMRSLHDYENYVYHLKEQLNIQEIVQSTGNERKEQRKEIMRLLKEEKKKLHELELETMELEKRKQDLLKWFEENATSFSRVKQEEMNDVTLELHKHEQAWFQSQEDIQKLEEVLEQLR